MSSPSSRELSRRRSVEHNKSISAEDQALNMMAQEAESRMVTSQAVLLEAKKIRNKERQRIRQETMNLEEEEDYFDGDTTNTSTFSTEDYKDAASVASSSGLEKTSKSEGSSVDQNDVGDLEIKYKKVMMTNVQLENEKISVQYQVDLLKENLSDLNEQVLELSRVMKGRSKEIEDLKFELRDEREKNSQLIEDVRQRDQLIKENGLVLIPSTESSEQVAPLNSSVSSADKILSSSSSTSLLLPSNCVELLKNYDGPSLGDKLKQLMDEKLALAEENSRLLADLDVERSRLAIAQKYQTSFVSSAPDINDNGAAVTTTASESEIQPTESESKKNAKDLKLKLKRAEKEITTLQGSVSRLEGQVNRYKTSTENSEKLEEQLKQEKKSLKNELREAQKQIEELSHQNTKLTRKLERNNKSTKNATTTASEA